MKKVKEEQLAKLEQRAKNIKEHLNILEEEYRKATLELDRVEKRIKAVKREAR